MYMSTQDSAVELMLTLHKTLAANLTGSTGMGSSSSSAVTSGGSSSSSAAGSSGVSTNDKFFEPFLAVLPRFGSMRSLYTYPQKYLAVLQHPAVVSAFAKQASILVGVSQAVTTAGHKEEH